MPLRLSTERHSPKGKATSKADRISTIALRWVGDYIVRERHVTTIHGEYMYEVVHTHRMPVAWATMGGARSPMMTKKAMQHPRLRPITLRPQ